MKKSNLLVSFAISLVLAVSLIATASGQNGGASGAPSAGGMLPPPRCEPANATVGGDVKSCAKAEDCESAAKAAKKDADKFCDEECKKDGWANGEAINCNDDNPKIVHYRGECYATIVCGGCQCLDAKGNIGDHKNPKPPKPKKGK